LEVGVQAIDDVLLVVGEPRDLLLLRKREDLLVELGPELDTARRDLVDRLTEFRVDRHDSSRRLVVGLFPVAIVDSGGIDDQLLDGFRSVRLLGDHSPRTEQETIERHPRDSVSLGPDSREVRVGSLGVSETGTCEELDVRVLTDGGVRSEDRGVEVFARVVTSGTSSSPLEDDREVRVRSGNVDNLTDTVDRSCCTQPLVSDRLKTPAKTGTRERTRLERDVLDAGLVKTIDDLLRLLGRRDTSGDTETFNGGAFLLHLLPERELERKLTLVDVERVQGDSDSRLVDEFRDLVDLGTNGLLVVMSSSGEFDVVTGLETGRNESSFDGRRCPMRKNANESADEQNETRTEQLTCRQP
jgi:hypothetical protein